MLRRPITAALWVALSGTACDATPRHIVDEGRARALQERGVDRFDSARAYPLAGVSAVRQVNVEPLRPEALGGDTLGPAFHAFTSRCGACHEAPDPTSRTAAEWSTAVRRMHRNVSEAGLLPIAPEEGELILDFLQRHARMR